MLKLRSRPGSLLFVLLLSAPALPLLGCGSSAMTGGEGATPDGSAAASGGRASPGATGGSGGLAVGTSGGAPGSLGSGGAVGGGSGGSGETSATGSGGGRAATGSGGGQSSLDAGTTPGRGGNTAPAADAGVDGLGSSDARATGTGGTAATGGGAGGAPGDGSAKITVWLAGDSTMADGGNTCPVGWGKSFQSFFNTNAKVVNSAVGGTTVRSWLYDVTSTLGADGECTLTSPTPQAHWTAIADGMKPGDYLFIQFGINDTTAATCPKHVSTAMFKQLFGMMAQAAKDKGANPVFLTAVSSISCSGAMAQGTRGGFATVTKAAGMELGVPVIDLEQLSVALYTASGFCPSTDTPATFTGTGPVGSFFCNDHTHFEAAGAKQIAALVAKAIRDQGFSLASYLLP